MTFQEVCDEVCRLVSPPCSRPIQNNTKQPPVVCTRMLFLTSLIWSLLRGSLCTTTGKLAQERRGKQGGRSCHLHAHGAKDFLCMACLLHTIAVPSSVCFLHAVTSADMVEPDCSSAYRLVLCCGDDKMRERLA